MAPDMNVSVVTPWVKWIFVHQNDTTHTCFLEFQKQNTPWMILD